MSEKKSVSFNEHTLGIVGKAAIVWPEYADNFSGLVQAIIADWDRGRSEGGKFQRLNARIDNMETVQASHTLMLKLLCEKVGVSQGE